MPSKNEISLKELAYAQQNFNEMLTDCAKHSYQLEVMEENIKIMEDIVVDKENEMDKIKKDNPTCFMSDRDFFGNSENKRPSKEEKEKVITIYESRERERNAQQSEIDKIKSDFPKIVKTMCLAISSHTFLIQSRMIDTLIKLEPELGKKALESYRNLIVKTEKMTELSLQKDVEIKESLNKIKRIK